MFDKRPDQAIIDLIKLSADADINKAKAAQYELAKALEEPLRQGVLVGDVVTGIFQTDFLEPGASPEWPLDLLAPGEEDEFTAFVKPNAGRIPERGVEGDYVKIPTFQIANAIDFLLRYAAEARWNIVARAMQVMQAGFTKKINDSGWQVLLAAAADRNILVFDADASAGQFTKRLLSLAKVTMQRHGGGNSASLKRAKLTDAYSSPETIEGIRNWGVDQVDEITRRELYVAADGTISRIFGVNLHDLVEFGEGQEYQGFFTGTLGATLASSDVELMIGLDMQNKDSFIMPIRQNISVYADDNMHRQGRQGYYGWGEMGFGVLDGRRVLAMSY
jgi:hypothetical protein